MDFSSIHYICFLAFIFILSHSMPPRAKLFILVLSSILFYSALKKPHLLLALGITSLLTFWIGLAIDRANPKIKSALLLAGITANLLVLIFPKYFLYFIPGTSVGITQTFVIVGVSFFTLQAISYLADIFLGRIKPENNFLFFFLFLAFFPKLLLGPIERARDLIPQLRKKPGFQYNEIRLGLLLFAWGLFKKVAVADRTGSLANIVYDNVHGFGGLSLLSATYLYAFQIYCDFSGYTDMAMGSAKLLGITLTQNFNSPYFATSVADFWRRWHISFSSWILEYIFKPLQLSFRKMKRIGTVLAVLCAFFFSGLWHGTEPHFLAWALILGMMVSIPLLFPLSIKPPLNKLKRQFIPVLHFFSVFLVFHLICFAWIFFRSNTCADAFFILQRMFSDIPQALIDFFMLREPSKIRHLAWSFTIFRPWEFLLALALIISIFFEQYIRLNYRNFGLFFLAQPTLVRWSAYTALWLSIANLGKTSEIPFVYFSF